MPSREPELYKDKVEVSLDGRQIFYLFFGGATIVGVVFVLGVLVGRRVEARGHIDRARTQASTDPLAALDRLEGGGLSFRGTLSGTGAPTDVEKTIGALEVAPGAITKPEAKPEAKPIPRPEPKAEPAADVAATAAARPVTRPEDAKPEEAKPRFTLQLSSFQDKAEAEAFLSSVKAQGYQAQISQAEVQGKGTFYRVRMGTYRTLDAALTARADFEKVATKAVSIMKL